MQKKRRNRCMLQTVQMLSLICVNFILSSDRHHKTGHFQIKENDLLSQKKKKKKEQKPQSCSFFCDHHANRWSQQSHLRHTITIIAKGPI